MLTRRDMFRLLPAIPMMAMGRAGEAKEPEAAQTPPEPVVAAEAPLCGCECSPTYVTATVTGAALLKDGRWAHRVMDHRTGEQQWVFR